MKKLLCTWLFLFWCFALPVVPTAAAAPGDMPLYSPEQMDVLLTNMLPDSQKPATVAQGTFGPNRHVFDAARLFKPEEIKLLNSFARELTNRYHQDIVIVTTNDAQGKSAMAYADDFYDENGFGYGLNFDGILFLIDMDNREMFISTSGASINIFSDNRLHEMLEKAFGYASRGQYSYAAEAFLKDTQHYLQKTYDIHWWSWEFFVAGLAVIFVILGSLIARHRKGLMTVTSACCYVNFAGIVGINESNDILLRTTTRLLAEADNTSNRGGGARGNGGSTTRTSSGGRKHGGMGRKF